MDSNKDSTTAVGSTGNNNIGGESVPLRTTAGPSTISLATTIVSSTSSETHFPAMTTEVIVQDQHNDNNVNSVKAPRPITYPCLTSSTSGVGLAGPQNAKKFIMVKEHTIAEEGPSSESIEMPVLVKYSECPEGQSEYVDNNKKVEFCDKGVQATDLTDGQMSIYKWTVDDVVQFFCDRGFREEAVVFREQEIDGLALVMMRRCDVLVGLKLLLGPALKIYRLIVQLQEQ